MTKQRWTLLIWIAVACLIIGTLFVSYGKTKTQIEIFPLETAQAAFYTKPMPEPTTKVTPVITPEPSIEPTPAPTPKPTEIPLALRQETQCAALEALFCRGADSAYQVFPRKSPGVFLQYGGVYTIGVPEHWDEGEKNLILFFDPDQLPIRGKTYYGGEIQNPYVCAEDRIDLLMDANPDTVVAMMSCQWSEKYMTKLLDAMEKLSVQQWRRVISAGWSAGGNRALRCAAAIVNDYPAMGAPVVVLNDCNHTDVVEAEVYNTIAAHELKCLLFTSNELGANGHKLWDILRRQIPIAIVYTDFERQPESNTHIDRLRLGFAENLYGFALGVIPELPGETFRASYCYGVHDYESNSIAWGTAEDVQKLLWETNDFVNK